MKPIKVILYSKESCPLCEQAKEVLHMIKKEIPLSITEIDIYKNDALLEEYQIRIPVIHYDGEVIDEGVISENTVRKRLLLKIK
jgi:glutaredoxin